MKLKNTAYKVCELAGVGENDSFEEATTTNFNSHLFHHDQWLRSSNISTFYVFKFEKSYFDEITDD